MTYSFWRREKREKELEEELQSHLRMAVQDRTDRGESAPAATNAARKELGNVRLIHQVTQDQWGWRWLEYLRQDLPYGLRTMRRTPGFTAIAIITLALGIGANTAIFGLMDAFLWKSLPVKDAQQLFFVRATQPNGGTAGDFPYPVFEQLRDRNTSFSGMFAWDDSHVNVTVEGQSEIIDGDFVSGTYFDVLKVDALLGRTFTTDDDVPGTKPVAVISYAYWKRRFAQSPAAIGKVIYVGSIPFTIVGVTSPRFFGRNVAGRSADIVLPMFLQPQLRLADHDTFEIMARLKPGISMDQARADMEVIYQQALTLRAGSEMPAQVEKVIRAQKIVLKSGLGGESQPTDNFATEVRILATVVGVALLLACVNIAGLLLARASARQKEIAVRTAMGAGRGRLICQLLAESVLLSIMGGALGLLFAKWGVGLLLTVLAYGASPITFDLNLDPRILAFTGAISLLTGILFGLAPALTGTRVNLNLILKGTEGHGESRVLHRGLTKSLVVAQVALSLSLLIGSGLLLRSLKQLYAVDTGYERDRVLKLWVFPALNGYEHGREMNLYRELSEKLNAIPGVQSASLSRLQMVYGRWDRNIRVPGSSPETAESRQVYCDPVGPRFFETMGISLLLGREFSAADTETSPRVAIISESMARKFFPNENPLGRHFGFVDPKSSGEVEIVGVVKDIRHHVADDEPREAAWIPHTQATLDMYGQMNFLVRTAVPPAAIIPVIRSQVLSIDKSLPLSGIDTVGAELDEYLGGQRSMASLLSFFGALALVLASLGLYGTLSFAVGRRTKELGIRLALGAQRKDMFGMVLHEALSLVAIGIVIGVPLALAASRLISSMLFGVGTTDPLTISSAILVMSATALLAAYIPARRAMRVDPIVALRYE